MFNFSQEALYKSVNSLFKKGGLHQEEGELFDENVSIPQELQVLLKIARKVVSPSKDERLYRYAIKQLISWTLYDFVVNEERLKKVTWMQTLFAAVAIDLQYLSSFDRNLFIEEVLKNMKQGNITSPYQDNQDWVTIVQEEALQYFDRVDKQKIVGKTKFNNERAARLDVCVRAIQYATMFHPEPNDYLQGLTEKLKVEMEKRRVSVTENISPTTSPTEQLSSVEKTKATVAGMAQFGGVASPIRQGTASAENPEEQENADIEYKKAASKWYMNTTFDFDISWKKSILPMLFLIGLVAIVEVSHFYGGKINIPILVNLAFLSTILSCYSYWQKMTIPELWNALRTIINLWITDVDESTIYRGNSSSIGIRFNVEHLGYLQQVQSFSREINVLGVLMVVMILAAISSLFASPVLFGVVVPFAILLSYGTINILAYAMARQVQLYRTLAVTP